MSNIFKSEITDSRNETNFKLYQELIINFNSHIDSIKKCGGKAAIQRQHDKGRLTVRERINYLIDDNSSFFEIGIFSGFEMYEEIGGAPASGVITGIGKICNHDFMLIANDATVKAGAYFET